MKKKTQKERVLARIRETGFVDNFWAFHNYILRLGAIMCQLKKEGLVFEGKFGYELKKPTKLRMNYYYLVK